MKSKEFISEDVTLRVNKFPMHYGRRPKSFEKLYWNPFIKELTAAMRKQKGKWDGYGFMFPSAEKAAVGQAIMDEFKAQWNEIEKLIPEGPADLDVTIADNYFKQNAASRNPNSR